MFFQCWLVIGNFTPHLFHKKPLSSRTFHVNTGHFFEVWFLFNSLGSSSSLQMQLLTSSMYLRALSLPIIPKLLGFAFRSHAFWSQRGATWQLYSSYFNSVYFCRTCLKSPCFPWTPRQFVQLSPAPLTLTPHIPQWVILLFAVSFLNWLKRYHLIPDFCLFLFQMSRWMSSVSHRQDVLQSDKYEVVSLVFQLHFQTFGSVLTFVVCIERV